MIQFRSYFKFEKFRHETKGWKCGLAGLGHLCWLCEPLLTIISDQYVFIPSWFSDDLRQKFTGSFPLLLIIIKYCPWLFEPQAEGKVAADRVDDSYQKVSWSCNVPVSLPLPTEPKTPFLSCSKNHNLNHVEKLKWKVCRSRNEVCCVKAAKIMLKTTFWFIHTPEKTQITYTMKNSLDLFPWFCYGGGLTFFLWEVLSQLDIAIGGYVCFLMPM